MRERLAEAGVVTALATIVTLLLAAPVLRSPSERIFGAEIVGRHHDPFTVMQQFTRPLGLGIYSQPITDVTGALLARVSSEVIAYNWLILISFPLTAAAAYLLARHLALSRIAATAAAMACAFSPFHLAHAAYHPHIAQVQWLPLYLLALWRCLDAATPGAVVALAVTTLAVTLSNFYGGFIAAVITPIAVAAYWLARRPTGTAPARPLVITAGTLLLLASAALLYARWMTGAAPASGGALTASRVDLFRYSAEWWSYLMPPVVHPLLGPPARRFWDAEGVSIGLLEQQVSLGWGVMTLGLVAIAGWWVRIRPTGSLHHVPTLVIVAVTALLCSLSPEQLIGSIPVSSPSALLYHLMPTFRSYARFGVVVQLMAVLLAGIGVELLLQSRARRARLACAALLILAIAEYAVAPSALWRDVLPTTAHRWVMQHAGTIRVLDCIPGSDESASLPWLTHSRVTTLSHSVGDCAEPNLGQKLAAHDYTHLLVRRSVAAPWVLGSQVPDGFQLAASFGDGRVFAVTAVPPAIYTTTMTGFSPREHDRDWSWQWMGTGATWIVASARPRPALATLDVELAAFHRNRYLTVVLDGQDVQTLVIEPERRTYRLGPFALRRGAHELAFRPAEPPTVADDVIHNRDRRPLSVAVGKWTWNVAEDHP